MDYLLSISDWAQRTRIHITNQTLRVSSCARDLRAIVSSVPMAERHAAFTAARAALEAAAYDAYRDGSMGRKIVPKLLLYHSLKYIMWGHLARGEKLIFLMQWAYTYLAGRQLTLLGVVIFYFLVAGSLTTVFSFFYIGGLQLSSSTTSDVSWYHYPYFSAVTLTTLGFGDIHPCTPFTMAIAAFQAFTGYLLLGLAVSTVVSFNSLVVLPPEAPTLTEISKNLKMQHTKANHKITST